MKVGLSTSVIQGGETGIAQYVLALTRAMLELEDGPELTLFVLEEDLPLFDFVRGRAHLEVIPESRRPTVRNILWHQRELPRLVRRLGLDVLHVPSYRRMLWSRPCPLVTTIHDLAPFHSSGKGDWLRRFYDRVVVRQFARRQSEIIAVSKSTARDITRFWGRPAEKLQVIHHGLDHDRFYPADVEEARFQVAAAYGVDQPFILYVSRLEHPGKNHGRLIEAFNRFKQRTPSSWQLVLGGRDGHGAEAIHAAAASSPFASDIQFLGSVPDDLLPTLYRAAGVAAHPSLFEGFGFPPLEAMACGTPVLTTHRGALAEVVSRAAAIVDPEDIDAMARGLERLVGDRLWRKSLVSAGLENAARFSWEACAAATHAVWERAAAKGRVPCHRIPLSTPQVWAS